MRNLRQYPITDEEILRTIENMKEEIKSIPVEQRAFGDIRLAVLNKMTTRFTDLLAIENEVNKSY